jgi:hypothetical protein
MNTEISVLVSKLNLLPHPEGGWYKETYSATETIALESGSNAFPAGRNFSTAIYFLLEGVNFSAFHRIKSDELWHFYTGSALHVYVIHENGTLEIIKMGSDLEKGEVFQATVKAGCWFASQCADANGFSLVGCTVSPGFDFQDFEMAKRAELKEEYPTHSATITALTRS